MISCAKFDSSLKYSTHSWRIMGQLGCMECLSNRLWQYCDHKQGEELHRWEAMQREPHYWDTCYSETVIINNTCHANFVKLFSAVEGTWSSWSSWGACSKSCGSGQRGKTRSFAGGGMPCSGAALDSETCQGIPWMCSKQYCWLFNCMWYSCFCRWGNLDNMGFLDNVHPDKSIFQHRI